MRVEVTAVEGADLDEFIFIHKRNPPSAYTSLSCDNFEAVAGPPQLSAYPAGEPDADHGWPYYRLSYVELDFASTAQADSVWKEIQAEVCVLVDAMSRLTELNAVEDVWCPGPPASDSESSESV